MLVLPIRSNISETLPEFKYLMKGVLSRLEPFAMRIIHLASGFLPFTLPGIATHYMSKKLTMIFTNLNASKVPYKWAGLENKSAFILAQAPGACSCAIMLLTIGNQVRLSCPSDTSMI